MLSIKLKNKKAIVVNDFHLPFNDPVATDLFFKFLKDFKPHYIVINGDLMDCFEISDFSKSAWSDFTFKDEISQTKKFFKKLRTLCPQSEIIYIEGNHEFRIKKYLSKNAKELAFLDGVQLENILELQKFGVKYVGLNKMIGKYADNYIKLGDYYVGHFNRVNKHSAYTAKNLLEDKGVSIIQGHTHRGGVHYKTLVNGHVHKAIENYCMCLTSTTYIRDANWQVGWSCLIDNYLCPIELSDNKFYWGNKKYE